MSEFDYDSPQYIDFTQPNALDLKEMGEDYFDVVNDVEVKYSEEITITTEDYQSADNTINSEKSPTSVADSLQNEVSAPDITENHEEQSPTSNIEDLLQNEVSAPEITEEQSPSSIIEDSLQNKVTTPETKEDRTALRKSLSTGHLEVLSKNDRQLTCSTISHLMNKMSLNGPRTTISSRFRAASIGNVLQKSRSVSQSRDGLNKISSDSLHSNKYVSLAEAIKTFHFKTPQRFHTTSSKQKFDAEKCKREVVYTIAQSPLLCTKSRARATVYKTREEIEEDEAAEMKKHQIKANPMNYKVFRTPVLHPNVEKRRNTEVHPFKFTEVKYNKGVPPTPEKVYEFHARPAPKFTQPIVNRTVKPATQAQTPTFMRKLKTERLAAVCENSIANTPTIKNVTVNHDGIMKKVPHLTNTTLKPFSFEERNKQMQQKKEEKIKKILAEEKKLREFYAKPIPTKVVSGCQKIESKIGKSIREGSTISLVSSNEENSEPNNDFKRFKARPASVLYKKPFVPAKVEHQIPEATEFNLHSERRGKERVQYDKMLKEKEAQVDIYRKLNDETTKKKEEEAVALLRKERVHKANPIRQYKHVEIHPSDKKVTSPRSPLFASKSRKRNNDE